MRLFHISDLHIGLKLINMDLIEDQKYILDKIIEYAKEKQPDVVLIAGDIFDRAIPSIEAVELFDEFISKLIESLPDKGCVMAISGNHDSSSRLDCYRDLLKHYGLHMIGKPPMAENERIEKVVLKDAFGNVNFYLLPFIKPSMVKPILGVDEEGRNFSYNESVKRIINRENIDESERNVIVSHQFYIPYGERPEDMERCDSEIVTVGNIDQVNSSILEKFDYAALGHIHKAMKVGAENIRYAGTPLACSVSESGQEKSIVMIDLKDKNTEAEINFLPLKPLRKVRKLEGTLKELRNMPSEDYVSILLTDKVDLDTVNMYSMLRNLFPNMLEVRRKTERTTDYYVDISEHKILDSFELCCEFLPELEDEEKDILKDIINTVSEKGEF